MYLDYQDFNSWAKTNILDDNMFDSDGNIIMDNKTDYKSTGTICKIFIDWWEKYYDANKSELDKIRPNVHEEIMKMIKCHNHELGSSVYECTECHELYFCHHTCKGKFCSSCGAKTQKVIAENILRHCYNIKHRQMVFTIPKEFRNYFISNYYLLNILFDAVRDTLYSIVNGKVKKKKRSKKRKRHTSKQTWMPGFFSFLHTYGRDVKWNPHVHVLIAEMKMGSIDVYKKVDYFDYNALSKRFMTILLNKMEKHFGRKFRKIKNECYDKYPNGFYVYAEPKKFKNLIDGIMYLARYGSHPAISENRILDYDGKYVTFAYTDHKDKEYHEVTVTAPEFISMLIKHIAPKYFKVVRYYGFYSKKHKFHDKMIMMISRKKSNFRKSLLKWNNLIITSFQRFPLECPNCGNSMEYLCEVVT